MLAAGTAATLSGCALGGTTPGRPKPSASPAGSGTPSITPLPPQTAGGATPPPPFPTASPPSLAPVATAAVLDRIPVLADGTNRFALTVDDGVSTDVLDAYVDFVIKSGIRLTFFVNGVRDSWTAVRPKLAPLVESGQVQLGNHTWDHPSVTGLSAAEITDQLERNERFLTSTYGVSGRPYFRPPYGSHNQRTDEVTYGLGFDRTVMWWGSLGDSSILTPAQVLAAAKQWFLANRVVIGHANHPAVTHIYPQLTEIIRERNLQTVTLRDVFGDEPTSA